MKLAYVNVEKGGEDIKRIDNYGSYVSNKLTTKRHLQMLVLAQSFLSKTSCLYECF